jgi:hypothetical protein
MPRHQAQIVRKSPSANYIRDLCLLPRAVHSTDRRHIVPLDVKAASGLGRRHSWWLAGALMVVPFFLAHGVTALAATAPNLGSDSTYGVVSSTFTNANTSPQTIINGGVCFTTPPTTPPLIITGATVTPCPPATGLDEGLALANLNGQACTFLGAAIALNSVVIGANPPGTIPPGCYFSSGAMDITVSTTVTLNGAGVYIFRPGGALTTGADSRIVLAGGACAADVFWAPVGATSLGANTAPSLTTPTFAGNILDAAGITLGHFANLTGRALAFGGTVTADANTVTVPACAPFTGGIAIPTVSEWAMFLLAAAFGILGFRALRRRTV